MAVYTKLNHQEIQHFLLGYGIGECLGFKEIAEGVENSNFLLVTTRGKFILTIFEKRIHENELPYCLGLMEHLHDQGIHCPSPVVDKDGHLWRRLKDKPAAIVTFIDGQGDASSDRSHEITSVFVARQLGHFCARMHLAAQNFRPEHARQNALSLSGWCELTEKIERHPQFFRKTNDIWEIVQNEIDKLKRQWPFGLPSGPVHADLFPDNVFFIRNDRGFLELNGAIDFYFACEDAFAYDLAICMNAWGFYPTTGHFHWSDDWGRQFLASYEELRPLTLEEKLALPILLRGAALRFLLTRTYDFLNQVEGALVTPKDPNEYAQKLQYWHTYSFSP